MALATETNSSARGSLGVEQLRGLERSGPGNFDLAVEVCGSMLQRLEFADQAAELLALLQIFEGHLARAGRDADQLGRGARTSGIECSRERRPAAIDLADDRVGVDFDLVEG